MTELNKAETRNSAMKGKFAVEDSLKAASELVHILLNLRHHTKAWEQDRGSEAKERKKFWEDKADQWIEDHKDKNTE